MVAIFTRETMETAADAITKLCEDRMLSHNSKVYAKKMALLTPEQQKFVDDVFAMCEKHYEEGGDTIVECYDPQEIVKEFTSLDDVKSFCGLKLEQALNCRWGEDDDDELTRMKNFEQNW